MIYSLLNDALSFISGSYFQYSTFSHASMDYERQDLIIRLDPSGKDKCLSSGDIEKKSMLDIVSSGTWYLRRTGYVDDGDYEFGDKHKIWVYFAISKKSINYRSLMFSPEYIRQFFSCYRRAKNYDGIYAHNCIHWRGPGILHRLFPIGPLKMEPMDIEGSKFTDILKTHRNLKLIIFFNIKKEDAQ